MNTLFENNETYDFKSSFVSRLRNFSLSPTTDNALMPVFEAITNSLHGIQERFSADWMEKGHVDVSLFYGKDKQINNILISDNGIGLNIRNFDSFITSDSDYKIKKGGKGIGRFSWLKAFDFVEVTSLFNENGKEYRRKFKFVADNPPITEHSVEQCASNEPVFTEIRLCNMKSEFKSKFPDKLETVVKKSLTHFLPTLIASCPDIYITDTEKSINIKEKFCQHQYHKEGIELMLDIGDGEPKKFVLQNIMMDKGCVSDNYHCLYLSANHRIVNTHPLNNQIGLSSAIDYNDKKVFYVGVLSGSFLDSFVFGERSSFDMSEDAKNSLVRGVIDNLREGYLKKPIEEMLDDKAKTVDRILMQYPRYRYMIKDEREFAKTKLSPAHKKEEEIFRELSLYDFRENKKLQKEVKDVVEGGIDDKDFDQKIQNIVAKISEQNKSALSEYVLKRKGIIDILQGRLGYKDPDTQERYTEEAIHRIICPMITDSNDITYMNHNLWLLDDRLAYYEYFASDKQIRTFVKKGNSKKEPDIILFNGCTTFQRPAKNQPVVIVEFKRPFRNDYSDTNNPIMQVYKYIDDLKNQKVVTPDGRAITEIDDRTQFFCYIICDITPTLKKYYKKS